MTWTLRLSLTTRSGQCPTAIPVQLDHSTAKTFTFSCIKFKTIKGVFNFKVLITISRGLKFGHRKTRIAIWLNMRIKLQKAKI